ncbi:MAG: hypothetical protein GY821_12920 [Gammaproteobacteria bacterium]|nr:hypothetical protein [Gammaproteobacteria bacterium]
MKITTINLGKLKKKMRKRIGEVEIEEETEKENNATLTYEAWEKTDGNSHCAGDAYETRKPKK